MSPPSGGVPILDNNHQHHLDGGQEYAVELSTIDASTHVAAMKFPVPTGPDGTADLAALKAFDPAAQAMNAVAQRIGMAQLSEAPPGQRPPVFLPVLGDRMVVLAHVVSFRYLGKVTAMEPGTVTVERPDGNTHVHHFGDLYLSGSDV